MTAARHLRPVDVELECEPDCPRCAAERLELTAGVHRPAGKQEQPPTSSSPDYVDPYDVAADWNELA